MKSMEGLRQLICGPIRNLPCQPQSLPQSMAAFLLLLRSAQWRTLRRHVECGGPIDAQCHDAVPVEVPGAANQGLTRQEERDIKQRVMRPAVFLFRMQPRVHAFPQGLDIQRLRQVQGLHLHPQVVVPTLGADDLLLLFGLRGRGAVDGRKHPAMKIGHVVHHIVTTHAAHHQVVWNHQPVASQQSVASTGRHFHLEAERQP
mmetsp:Transcript_70694/g.155968  ORF Transcript_70694/g.155968 Transcript_70694/m.155968 type:complete len:202 (-) Transcript_70694:497-1102(-)